MADPHIRAVLEPADRVSVGVYRASIGVGAAGLVGLGLGQPWAPWTLAGAALVAGWSIHLYDPRFRRFARIVSVPSAVLVPLAGAPLAGVIAAASLAGSLATFAFVAGKEHFCFKIPGLPAVPWLLVAAGLLLAVNAPGAAAWPLVPSGLILGWLAVAKARQPLDFDIGDRSAYR